jgi:hypothetical protein
MVIIQLLAPLIALVVLRFLVKKIGFGSLTGTGALSLGASAVQAAAGDVKGAKATAKGLSESKLGSRINQPEQWAKGRRDAAAHRAGETAKGVRTKLANEARERWGKLDPEVSPDGLEHLDLDAAAAAEQLDKDQSEHFLRDGHGLDDEVLAREFHHPTDELLTGATDGSGSHLLTRGDGLDLLGESLSPEALHREADKPYHYLDYNQLAGKDLLNASPAERFAWQQAAAETFGEEGMYEALRIQDHDDPAAELRRMWQDPQERTKVLAAAYSVTDADTADKVTRVQTLARESMKQQVGQIDERRAAVEGDMGRVDGALYANRRRLENSRRSLARKVQLAESARDPAQRDKLRGEALQELERTRRLSQEVSRAGGDIALNAVRIDHRLSPSEHRAKAAVVKASTESSSRDLDKAFDEAKNDIVSGRWSGDGAKSLEGDLSRLTGQSAMTHAQARADYDRASKGSLTDVNRLRADYVKKPKPERFPPETDGSGGHSDSNSRERTRV